MRTIKYTNQVSLVFPPGRPTSPLPGRRPPPSPPSWTPPWTSWGRENRRQRGGDQRHRPRLPGHLGKGGAEARLYPGNELELIVRDWGVGIPDIEQARTPSSPPAMRSARAWALPSWRVSWTP